MFQLSELYTCFDFTEDIFKAEEYVLTDVQFLMQ